MDRYRSFHLHRNSMTSPLFEEIVRMYVSKADKLQLTCAKELPFGVKTVGGSTNEDE